MMGLKNETRTWHRKMWTCLLPMCGVYKLQGLPCNGIIFLERNFIKRETLCVKCFCKKYGVEMLLDCLEKMRKLSSVIIELESSEIMMAEQWKKFSGCY